MVRGDSLLGEGRAGSGPDVWDAPLGQKDWAHPLTSGFLCLLPSPLAASVPTGLLAATSSAGGTEQVSWYSPGSSGVEEGMRAPGLGGTPQHRCLCAWASLDTFWSWVPYLCSGHTVCLTYACELLEI